MAYSTITKRKCKCSEGCKLYPTLGYSGFAFSHAPQEIKDAVGSKKKAARKTRQAKLSTMTKLRSVQNSIDSHKQELELWFRARRLEMTGVCACGCGEASSKDNDKFFKFSAAHVLAKARFPSIALHAENCIELAFFGGCHSVFDDMGYEHCKNTKPILWSIVVTKFKILSPSIAEDEKKRIPQILLDTL